MDFASLGAHCSLDSCRQKDFLPFDCSNCRNQFCLDHRNPVDHGCPARKDHPKVILCPLCSKSYKITREEVADSIINEHIRLGGCKQVIAKRKEHFKKNTCTVKSCRTTKNTDLCKKCNLVVCIK